MVENRMEFLKRMTSKIYQRLSFNRTDVIYDYIDYAFSGKSPSIIKENNSRNRTGKFSKFTSKLKSFVLLSNEILKKINENSSSLNATAGYIAVSSQSYLDISQSLNGQVESILPNLNEIIVNINDVTKLLLNQKDDFNDLLIEIQHNRDSTKQTLIFFKDLYSTMMKQGNLVEETVSTIDELSESMNGISNTTVQINNISSNIDGLSKQTFLLSLNASIEAAHAGESGQGFSVVSSEISKLSSSSSNNLKNIQKFNNDIKESIKETYKRFQDMNQLMGDLQKWEKGTKEKLNDYSLILDKQVEHLAKIENKISQSSNNLNDLIKGMDSQKTCIQNFEKLVKNIQDTSTNISFSANDLIDLSEELKEISHSFEEMKSQLSKN
jgi:methyl-accepting chemotaxis protein